MMDALLVHFDASMRRGLEARAQTIATALLNTVLPPPSTPALRRESKLSHSVIILDDEDPEEEKEEEGGAAPHPAEPAVGVIVASQPRRAPPLATQVLHRAHKRW
jgi:hypothetical protein